MQIGAMSLPYIACVSFVGCIIFTGFCIEVTYSAPQKDVHQLNQELQKQGFKTLSSDNDFKSSMVAYACHSKINSCFSIFLYFLSIVYCFIFLICLFFLKGGLIFP